MIRMVWFWWEKVEYWICWDGMEGYDENGLIWMIMGWMWWECFLMKNGFWWEWEEKFWRGWNSGWRGHARGRQRGEAFVYCARCVFSIYNLLFVETFMIIIFCFFCILWSFNFSQTIGNCYTNFFKLQPFIILQTGVDRW